MQSYTYQLLVGSFCTDNMLDVSVKTTRESVWGGVDSVVFNMQCTLIIHTCNIIVTYIFPLDIVYD